jgi:malate dehydrogenase (quinone)
MIYAQKQFVVFSNISLFQGMEFSAAPKKLKRWIPLFMEGRT